MQIERRHVGKRLSQVVVHNETVYLAGIVADEPVPGDAGAQTENILMKIDRFLQEAGSDRTRMLSATIWLADISDYNAMNAVWDAWVPEGCSPARACVESKLAQPKYKVEIRIVAATGHSAHDAIGMA
ncbi:MAG: RidA family protein [Betaproteobacteria bacterium]|nr:RidA family protein [Betaproteobacteria bacterium]MBL8533635.1 RidA family protein [Betaproteobacteria bacterium]